MGRYQSPHDRPTSRQEVKAEHDLAPALVELIMHVEKSIPQGSGSAKTVEG